MDQKDQENLPKTSKISRREFLKRVGLAGASMIVGGGPLLAAAQKQSSEKTLLSPLPSPPSPPSSPSAPSAPSFVIPPPSQQEAKLYQTEETQPISPLEIFINHCPLFSNCSQEEKKIALSLVENQIKHYQKGYEDNPGGLKKRLEDSWGWKQTGIIDEVADALGFKKDSFARELLPALIFVESEGNPRAGQEKLSRNKNVAVGLCQLKPSTANELAKKLVMKTPVDLFNPWGSIVLALEFLHQKLQLYPDWSLTTWVYHLGEGNMNRAIYQYERSETERPISELDATFENSSFPATKRYIELDQLNFIKLVTSPAVTADLKSLGAFGDDTQHYVPRVAAASFMLPQTTA